MANGNMSDLDKLERMVEVLSQRDQEIIDLKDALLDYFENNSVPMHQVNTDGTIIRANIAELHSMGYTYEEYIGQPIAKFHADQDVVNLILQQLNNNEEIWRRDADLIHKDGHIIPVKITSSRGKNGLTRCLSMPVHIEDKKS